MKQKHTGTYIPSQSYQMYQKSYKMAAHFSYLSKIIWFSILIHRNIFSHSFGLFLLFQIHLQTCSYIKQHSVRSFPSEKAAFGFHWIETILLCCTSLNSHKPKGIEEKYL